MFSENHQHQCTWHTEQVNFSFFLFFSSLTFEFAVLILTNKLSCYLCLLFCTKFRGLVKLKKNKKISIKQIKLILQ
jgi:hypothetical protein